MRGDEDPAAREGGEAAFLRELLESQPGGLYRIRDRSQGTPVASSWRSVYDETVSLEFVSDRFCEVLGLTRDDLKDSLGVLVGRIIPQDRPGYAQRSINALARRTTFRWEGRALVRGEVRWIRFDSRPRVEPGGELTWTGVATDISDSRGKPDLFDESESGFSAAFHGSPIPMALTTTTDGLFLDVNDTLLEEFGFRREALLGRTLTEVGLVRDEGERDRLAADVLADGTVAGRPLVLHTATGDPRSCLVWTRVTPAAGEPCFLTSILDITARERVEADLERIGRLHEALVAVNKAIVRVRSRDELFRAVTNALVEQGGFEMAWVAWHDRQTHRVDVAASCGDVGGYLSQVEVYADERPEGLGPTGTAIREGRPYVCNDFLRDPRTRPWAEHASRAPWRASAAFPLRLQGLVCGALSVYARESGFFLEREVALLEQTASDLSFGLDSFERERRRKEAEEEILELNSALERRVAERTADLERANRELEAFSCSVSHDLRAPLRAIEGFSAIVAEDCHERLGEEAARHLAAVRTNARRMAQLIDDLLSFSRTGRSGISRSHLDMATLARAAFAEVAGGVAGPGGVTLRVGDLPPAEGDVSLLRQVWLNLVSNAVKFSSKTAGATVEIGGSAGRDEVTYFVRDNGVGFDPAHAGKLFGVFHRLHRSDEFEGTGIGLALVQRIVDRHGGRVWAESAVGQGATFWFTLPAEGNPGPRPS